MKKIKAFLFIFGFAFLMLLVACGGANPAPVTSTSEHNLTHVEEKLPTYFEGGNLEYWTCSHCDKIFKNAEATETYESLEATKLPIDTSMEGLLRGLDFHDVEVTYDGERHQLKYEGQRPSGIKIVCTPTTRYIAPGTYKYTIEVKYNGQTGYKTANLIIKKIQPKYLGETTKTVYLCDPSTQPSFEFDQEGVEVVDQPFYTETGTYKYTLKTKETATMSSCEPVEITYNVLDSKFGFKFESKTLVTDGVTPVSIQLEPVKAGTTLDTTKYEVIYENNSSNVQGKYQAKAQIVDKATKDVLEEYRAIFTVDYANNEEFDEYVDSVFKDFIEEDQISINLLTVDYKSLGLEHGDSTWYTFKGFDQNPEETYEHDSNLIKAEKETVAEFKAGKLSYSQLISLRRIEEYLQMYENLLKDSEYEYISLNYVDQYGGYVADFPTYVESYSFRTEEDIEDCIKMIESTGVAFPSYYDYIVAKRDAGYGLSEFTLNEFMKYTTRVIANYGGEDGYYLARVVTEKIDEAKEKLSLTDAKYNDYKSRLVNGINVTLKNALIELNDKVDEFIKTNTYFDDENFNKAYYGGTAKGRDLYYSQLQNRLGTFELSPKIYLEEIESYLKEYKERFKNVQSILTEYAESIQNGEVTVFDYGEDILDVFEYLYEFADEIVYPLSSKPAIDVTWMDPTTTANTNTVAYYMKSPLDSYSNEYIHLNGRSLGENNYETITSIAHEGYPGHLYAYVNSKENPNLSNLVRVATYTGHGEGWAKYVEYRIHEFMYDKNKDGEHAKDYEALMQYAQTWEPYIFMIYTRCDFGINYQGWKVADVAKFMKEYSLNSSMAQDLFDTLNESAGQYPPYGYGQVLFIAFHEEAKELLGAAYNEKELNKVILNQGWCSLDSLREYVAEYLEQQSFLLGF